MFENFQKNMSSKKAHQRSHVVVAEQSVEEVIDAFINTTIHQETHDYYDVDEDIQSEAEAVDGDVTMAMDDIYDFVPGYDFIERDDNNKEIRDEINQNVEDDDNDHANKRSTDELQKELRKNIKKKKMTRMQKSRYSRKLASIIANEFEKWNFDVEDENLLLVSAMERLGISTSSNPQQRKAKMGQPCIPLDVREAVVQFWIKNSSTSTNTTRPAKLRADRRTYDDLDFPASVKIVTNKRGIKFYESTWMIVEKTTIELLKELHNEAGIVISKGKFLSLKPFYVRAPTSKDIEMCVCKEHLHARWAIKCLVELCEKQNLNIDFKDYGSFFKFLYSTKCLPSSSSEYIAWSFAPDKNTLGQEIAGNWAKVRDDLISKSNDSVIASMLIFRKVERITPKGKVIKPFRQNANIKFVVGFIDDMLTKIIHHRNLLKNYRSNIGVLLDNTNNLVLLWIDFSENLTIPIKQEPQSLHWCKEQISVHSGISKQDGIKKYHPYLSDDIKHDQTFVLNVMQRMIDEVNIEPGVSCTSQYKSVQNFFDLQNLANEHHVKIIRIYGIPGHGKNETDCVGSVAKIAIRHAVTTGEFFPTSTDCVNFLTKKFESSYNPEYCIKEISPETLSLT